MTSQLPSPTSRPPAAALAPRRPCHDAAPLHEPAATIAVIVPVRNEERFIARTLEALLEQEYPPQAYEVLVVDGHSTDRTREIVAQYASRQVRVRLLDNPRQLSSAARNIGIRESQAEYLLIVDGHCEIEDRKYLNKLAQAFDRSGADCVGRPQPLDVTGATRLQQAIAAARSSRLGHHPDSHIYSATAGFVPAHSVAVAYRREVFERVGLFDERFDACEDVELNHRIDRAGLRCYFTPDIEVRYHPRESLAGLFHQLARYGRGRVRLATKHRDTWSVGSFLPAAFVLGLIAGLPLSFLSPWLAAVYFGSLAVYFAAIAVASVVGAAEQRVPQLLAILPVVFVTIHLACGWGVLSELVRGWFRSQTLSSDATCDSPAASRLATRKDSTHADITTLHCSSLVESP